LVTRRRGIQIFVTYTQPLIEKRKATNKSKAELEQLLSDPQGKREAPLGLIKSKEQREVKIKVEPGLGWRLVPSVVPVASVPGSENSEQ